MFFYQQLKLFNFICFQVTAVHQTWPLDGVMLTSHLHSKRCKKRITQLVWLQQNFDKNSQKWFYFDIYYKTYLFMNGKKRNIPLP